MSGPIRLLAPNDTATASIGAALADLAAPGDIILLNGDLGTGKTSLARAFIRRRMNDPALDVPSPSFALVQPYEAKTGPILHVDLYRLTSSAAAEDLGFLDEPDAIVLIEWPERAPELLTRARLAISLLLPEEGEGRLMTFQTGDAELARQLAALATRFPAPV